MFRPISEIIGSSVIISRPNSGNYSFIRLNSATESAIVKINPIKSNINLKLTCQEMTVKKKILNVFVFYN